MAGARDDTVTLLDARLRPSSENAKATFNAILQVTGELLSEVGFERLSTNMVAARAGLSPPALYRYFPNKYALLAELGRRLMAEQDVEVLAWHRDMKVATRPSLEKRVADLVTIMRHHVDITREMPGGVWVMRALRAVPILQPVRIESRDLVADSRYEHTRHWYPNTPVTDLRLCSRLSIELSYSAIEMVVEEPDLDPEQALTKAALMVETFFETMS